MAQGIPRWLSFALIFLLLLLLLLPNHWLAACRLSQVECVINSSSLVVGCESCVMQEQWAFAWEALLAHPSCLGAWLVQEKAFFVGCFTSWLVTCYLMVSFMSAFLSLCVQSVETKLCSRWFRLHCLFCLEQSSKRAKCGPPLCSSCWWCSLLSGGV